MRFGTRSHYARRIRTAVDRPTPAATTAPATDWQPGGQLVQAAVEAGRLRPNRRLIGPAGRVERRQPGQQRVSYFRGAGAPFDPMPEIGEALPEAGSLAGP